MVVVIREITIAAAKASEAHSGPVMSSAQPPSVLASDIGLGLHPRARAFFFPALGAYVGGDIVAGMLATGMDRDKRTRLFIDVGTNCEIVVSNGDRILATAAPAGPAFEGGAIRCGMRAADGAIEVIRYDRDDVAAEVARLTDGQGVDVVYDGVGKSTFDASLASLRPRGMMVLFGGASGQVPPFDIQRLNSSARTFADWMEVAPLEIRPRV